MTPALVAYVGMTGDLLHAGHINILTVARNLVGRNGVVIVGLVTDEAVETYKKRRPILTWAERAAVIRPLRLVDLVVAQTSEDYEANLRLYRPDFVVHGCDWKDSQPTVRQRVIEIMAEWGGAVIEPRYTPGISTSEIIKRIISRNVGATPGPQTN